MKEIITITLNANQVREACTEWAQARTSIAEADVKFTVNGVAEDQTVAVVVTNKRRSPSKKGAE
jgi:hypothetical protein